MTGVSSGFHCSFLHVRDGVAGRDRPAEVDGGGREGAVDGVETSSLSRHLAAGIRRTFR